MWLAQVKSLDPVHKLQWTVAAGFITWGDSQAVSLPGSCVENHVGRAGHGGTTRQGRHLESGGRRIRNSDIALAT